MEDLNSATSKNDRPFPGRSDQPKKKSTFLEVSHRPSEISDTVSNKPSLLQVSDSPSRNFKRSLLRLETLATKPKTGGGAFFNALLRQDSVDSPYSSSNFSRDDSPDSSPNSQLQQPTAKTIMSTFAMKHKKGLRGSTSTQQQGNTEQAADKYFFRIKTIQSSSTTNLHNFSTAKPADVSQEKTLNATQFFNTFHDGSLYRKIPKRFYSSLRKPVVLKEEVIISKPVASTVSLQNLKIKEKLQHLITATETSGRLTVTMRNLHEFLELIQNLGAFNESES